MKSLLGIDLPFYSYGILMGIAFILSIWLFNYNSRNSKIPRPPLIDILLVISIFGILGARINYILLFPQYYNSFRDYIALHEGGLVFYGGMLTALLALYIYCRIKKYHMFISLYGLRYNMIPRYQHTYLTLNLFMFLLQEIK